MANDRQRRAVEHRGKEAHGLGGRRVALVMQERVLREQRELSQTLGVEAAGGRAHEHGHAL
eukprot:2565375-Alexandrium_andersonii.AAC.1